VTSSQTSRRCAATGQMEHPRGGCPSCDREVTALLNVEKAARELDELFYGEPDAWRLDGMHVGSEASSALLSLHDYLNDVTNAREDSDAS
jgi:hypothetical protein